MVTGRSLNARSGIISSVMTHYLLRGHGTRRMIGNPDPARHGRKLAAVS